MAEAQLVSEAESAPRSKGPNLALIALAAVLCMPLGYWLAWREAKASGKGPSLELKLSLAVLVLTYLWLFVVSWLVE